MANIPSLRKAKLFIPSFLKRPISSLIRHGRVWRNCTRWFSILLSEIPDKKLICVCYGHKHIPGPSDPVRGGMVKFQRLQEFFPNSACRFNILYLGSSSMPADWRQLLWLSRRKGARLVWNQNGVGYFAWHGPGWEKVNAPMAKTLHAADYVFYQSRFCKLSADLFLGERQGPWEILYNAVDTQLFTPAASDPDPRHLVLLLGGDQYKYYRFEAAVRTLAILKRERSDVRLLVTGRLSWTRDELEAARTAQLLIADLGVAGDIEFLGPYSQKDGPAILRRAHLLLHTKHNDPCPNIVIEAMACGLPVVYSHSGGVPELVGQEAGIGVPVELSWEIEYPPPDPKALAEAVLQVADQRAQHAEAARQRAVEKFDLRPWIQRHQEVFEGLIK